MSTRGEKLKTRNTSHFNTSGHVSLIYCKLGSKLRPLQLIENLEMAPLHLPGGTDSFYIFCFSGGADCFCEVIHSVSLPSSHVWSIPDNAVVVVWRTRTENPNGLSVHRRMVQHRVGSDTYIIYTWM